AKRSRIAASSASPPRYQRLIFTPNSPAFVAGALPNQNARMPSMVAVMVHPYERARPADALRLSGARNPEQVGMHRREPGQVVHVTREVRHADDGEALRQPGAEHLQAEALA